jgi:hypothetical protein
MAIKDEIERPIVTPVYIDNGTLEPSVVSFDVEIRFKPVDGIVPFPPLKYRSLARENAAAAELKKKSLIDTLLDNASRYKKEQLFIKAQQAKIDTFLDQEWGR